MSLAVRVMELTKHGKWDYFLRDQTCRSAFSVPANIAEGNGRSTPMDYASFVDRARGSLHELDSWLEACARLHLITIAEHEQLENEIVQLGAMLRALGQTLRNKPELRSRI